MQRDEMSFVRIMITLEYGKSEEGVNGVSGTRKVIE
jgi:hypothetical protein